MDQDAKTEPRRRAYESPQIVDYGDHSAVTADITSTDTFDASSHGGQPTGLGFLSLP